jgi:hypothetical protein
MPGVRVGRYSEMTRLSERLLFESDSTGLYGWNGRKPAVSGSSRRRPFRFSWRSLDPAPLG